MNISSFKQEGSTATEKFETKCLGLTSRLSATATLTPSARVQITGNYLGREMFGQMEMEPRFLLGVSARQELFEKRFSLRLNIQNIFKRTATQTVDTGADVGR